MAALVASALLGIETVLFADNGMKCPLTALAVSYGAEKGCAFDTFLPGLATRHASVFAWSSGPDRAQTQCQVNPSGRVTINFVRDTERPVHNPRHSGRK